MDPAEYYKSVSKEMEALTGRVRYLINDGHWPSDGEWKESVLRTILRRHIPNTLGVGRGFIIGPSTASTQIDVLIYDNTRPVLHQDGDLVFVTSDAVRGVIEVKATIRRAELLTALEKLGTVSTNFHFPSSVFIGLFGYETEVGPDDFTFLLTKLKDAAAGERSRVVNHVSVGSSLFARYWDINQLTDERINGWYTYSVNDIAAGYFLANALEFAVGQAVRDNLWAWFPTSGKEIHKSGEISLA